MLEKFNFKNDDELRAALEFMLVCIKETYARNQALTAAVEVLAHVVTRGDSEAMKAMMSSIEEGLPEFQEQFDQVFKARFAGHGLDPNNLRRRTEGLDN